MRIVAVLLIALLAATQSALWSADGGVPAVLELQDQIAAQVLANARLRERNEALDAEVQDLKQGLAAVEERARSEMGMIKADEIFYQIIDTPDVPVGSERYTARRD